MTVVSKSLLTLGALFLAHATYSAHEHTILSTSSTSVLHLPGLTSSSPTTIHLPLDITLETVISTLLVAFALVLGYADETSGYGFKPVSWREWAGKIEREGKGAVGGSPFKGLEERTGFWDVRAKRREFMEWVKEQGGADKK